MVKSFLLISFLSLSASAGQISSNNFGPQIIRKIQVSNKLTGSPQLDLEGQHPANRCLINAEIARAMGFSIGELAILLSQQNMKVTCSIDGNFGAKSFEIEMIQK